MKQLKVLSIYKKFLLLIKSFNYSPRISRLNILIRSVLINKLRKQTINLLCLTTKPTNYVCYPPFSGNNKIITQLPLINNNCRRLS